MKKLWILPVAALIVAACSKEERRSVNPTNYSQSWLLGDSTDSEPVTVNTFVDANSNIHLHLESKGFCEGGFAVFANAVIENDTLLDALVTAFPFDTVVYANVSGDLKVNTSIEGLGEINELLCKTLGNVKVNLDVTTAGE